MNMVVLGQTYRSLGVGKKMSKNPHKRAMGKYLLNASREYTKALERRDGLHRSASPVRHIDPRTYESKL